MITACTKVDECHKVKMVLDKELIDYTKLVREVCIKCNEFNYPIAICIQADDTQCCVFEKCPIFDRCYKD